MPASRSIRCIRAPAIELRMPRVYFGQRGIQAVTALTPKRHLADGAGALSGARRGHRAAANSTILATGQQPDPKASTGKILAGRARGRRPRSCGSGYGVPEPDDAAMADHWRKTWMLRSRSSSRFKRTFQRDRKGAFRDRGACASEQVGLKDFCRPISRGNLSGAGVAACQPFAAP